MAQTPVTKKAIQELIGRIQDLYVEDGIPWVVGYSGGKDSTAVLQLVWNALVGLPVDQRSWKPVHVISTDTQVEQPIVAAWVSESLKLMYEAASAQGLPIIPHRLTPKLSDSYWVNLIGRGYPAPRHTFRWCTDRLKIQPSNRFIIDMVKAHGETILALGTRKAESAKRAANMERHEKRRVREWLSPNASLPNSLVFSPIENWSNDDVWLYLMQYQNPWGRSNKDLLTMYRGASPDNECPLVVDTSTPSCGNSRFGCWICTLVSADKSMQAMIQNDDEKAWMTSLLNLRSEIGPLDEQGRIDDRERRDYRRLDCSIKLNPRDGRAIHGPYTKKWREHFLCRVLEVEQYIRKNGPEYVRDFSLISDDQLREIRRIWVADKHEFDDSLPRIYERITGQVYPYLDDLESMTLGEPEWRILSELCNENGVYLDLEASLLDVEQRSGGLASRSIILENLETVIKRCYYDSEDDAVNFERHKHELFGENRTSYAQIGPDEGIEDI